MKKYILYTRDGNTETPKGEEIENCQILEFIEAKTEKKAIQTANELKTMFSQDGYEHFYLVEIKKINI